MCLCMYHVIFLSLMLMTVWPPMYPNPGYAPERRGGDRREREKEPDG